VGYLGMACGDWEDMGLCRHRQKQYL